MKKAFLIFLVLTLLIVPASLAVAGEYQKDTPLTMSAEQKSKMISLKTQILELKKQVIKQNLDNGTLTQEQAKKMEERINAKLEALKSGKLDQDFYRCHPPQCKPH